MNAVYQSHHKTTRLEKLLPWLRLILFSLGLVIILRTTIARAESIDAGLAQNPSASAKSLEESAELKVKRDARGRKMQYVDFSDALIEGKARTPDGFVIQSRTSGKFQSMIQLRSHFRDNIKIHALEAAAAIGLGD